MDRHSGPPQLFYGSQVTILWDLDASEHRLKSLPLERCRYLLFATHGILDATVPLVQGPALVLSRVGNPLDEHGLWTLSEVMSAKLNAEAVFLAACSTGVGKEVRGEGVMGMGRAFQYAGARAVVMSLWEVAEGATVELHQKIFRALHQRVSIREALQRAQREVRAVGYGHPYYWAAFILVGERGEQ